jgi:oligopeptide transport system substrate-binding protein
LGNPETKAEYATLLVEAKIKNAAAVVEGNAKIEELGVKALDDETLQIELESPAPFLIDLLAYNKFAPISEENVKTKGGIDQAFESMESTVYSGAYYMSEYVKGEKYIIKKSENFHSKDSVNVKSVNFKVYKDPDSAFGEFEQGLIDEVGVNTKDKVEKYKDDKNTKFIIKGATFYLANNMESEVMKNINVRKTIQYGIDYNSIYKDVIGTGPIGASSFTAKEITNPTYGEDYVTRLDEGRVYNQARAKEFADKAKAELGGSVKFKMVASETATTKKSLEAFQGELNQKYGFNVEVSLLPAKEYFSKIRQDKTAYDSAFVGWTGDYADPGTFMSVLSQKNPGLNYSRNSDQQLTQMIDEAAAEGDNNARLDKFAKAEKYSVQENAYVVPVAQNAGYRLTNGKFDYKPNTLKVQLIKYYEVK